MGEPGDTAEPIGNEAGNATEEESSRPFLPIPGFLPFGLGSEGFLDSAVDILFEEFDENANGNLSEDEIPMVVWNYLQQQGVDANSDNLITLDEVDAALESHRMDLFDRVDGNEDGVLTADEVPEFVWRRIENADTDENGVSFDEIEMYRMLTRFERFDGKR